MRILAIATNSGDGASTRFRILQWRSYLEEAGFHLHIEAFYSLTVNAPTLISALREAAGTEPRQGVSRLADC